MHDFQVKWQGDAISTANEIIKHLIVNPLRSGMPITVALVGKSRVGKSVFAILIQDIIYKEYGDDFLDILEHVVLIKPVDYAAKVKSILKGDTPIHKRCRTLQMDEAKFLINSDDWQSLRNKTIRTVAATSATIKPIAFFIIAQMLGDIDSKTRRTIDYLFTITRSPGQKPKVVPYTFYEKIDDLDRVKIKPRRLTGLVEYPNGKFVQYTPTFRPALPRQELLDKYHSFEAPDKRDEIFTLLDDIEKEANTLSGKDKLKLKEFAEYLVKNPDKLQEAGMLNKKGVWKFSKDALGRYNYSSKEFKDIEFFVEKSFEEKRLKELRGNDARESVVLSKVD